MPGFDDDGNPVEGSSILVYSGNCRAEVNGTGDVIRGEDGSELNFSFNVFLPKMGIDIAANSQAELVIGNKTIKAAIKRQSNGLLNSRIWL
jgi:hypothetical protein